MDKQERQRLQAIKDKLIEDVREIMERDATVDAAFETFTDVPNHVWHIESKANKEFVRVYWHEAYRQGFAAGREAERREYQPALQIIYRIVHGWSMDQTIREVELIEIRRAINGLDPFDEDRRITEGERNEL